MYFVTIKVNDEEFDQMVWKDDFIEYLWEEHFNKHFNPLSYVLDDPGSRVYKELEQKWVDNKIDEYNIIKEDTFVDFMTNKYKEDYLE